MKSFRGAALSALWVCTSAWAASAPPTEIPHLEKRGNATQLIVDGQPWLILGGELRGTASSSLAYMDEVWPKMTRLNLNTVLLALGWDWLEPEQGKFDFSLVDGLLEGARKHNKRIVFLWFGAWKNGISSFAPPWVKADQQRFPRVQVHAGNASDKSIEILSVFNRATLDADTRAYLKLLEHLKQVDTQHTVLMMQIQNEVGVHGDSRDRSALANKAYASAVPAELMRYLTQHKATLAPYVAKLWRDAGGKTSGSWSDVFGSDADAEQVFMAWHYARYIDHMAAAGKAVYPLPVFTNTWLVQVNDKRPGDYPSGGPQSFLIDVWKAGAPAIDMNSPDIYRTNFDEVIASFARPDNPMFIPESQGEAHGVANAFYAIGAHDSIGYSPFGIDDTAWLLAASPDKGAPGTDDLENTPLSKGYGVLRQLTPLILQHQAAGTINAAWLNKTKSSQEIALGDYILQVELRRSTRDQSFLSELGYAMVMALGPAEFLIAGSDVQVTFRPRTPGPQIAGIADAVMGEYVDGRWVAGRKRNGDDVLLNYKLAEQAQLNQSGSGLRFLPGAPTIQRVKLYRYQ